jgi:uncharacterized Zn-binding protein involved in type VI secretion
MPPAARLGDLHTCPKMPPGGAIIEGASSVSFDGFPAARINDACACADGPSHVGSGSRSVTIEGKPAARVGDATCHHGLILPPGSTSVSIGDATSFAEEGAAAPPPQAPAGAMSTAHANGAPFLRP